jgi:hypothetical protein
MPGDDVQTRATSPNPATPGEPAINRNFPVMDCPSLSRSAGLFAIIAMALAAQAA